MKQSLTEQYEASFRDWLGVRAAFAFFKGRVALYAALRGLGIGEGDEVIVSGYTCVMAVNPIMYLKARPVYVDIDPNTYNVTPDLVKTCITERTKAIIVQHTYGIPVPVDAIREIADGCGAALLEDCCLAVGSRWKGQIVGTFGVASYFSSQWNKPFTTGLGGVLAVNDDGLAGRVQDLCESHLVQPTLRENALLALQLAIHKAFIYPSTTAMSQEMFRMLGRTGIIVGSSTPGEFMPEMEEGFFKAMSGPSLRTGLKKLQHLKANQVHRKRLTKVYDEALRDRGFEPLQVHHDADPILVRYPVRVNDKNRALREASNKRVELGSWFECPLHPKETNLGLYGYSEGECPHSERASDEVVNLPLHPRVSDRTVRRTVEFIAPFLKASDS